jgi:hypothetical protein
MRPETAGIPLNRWLCYLGWSAVLGWIVWASIGGLVELCLAGIMEGHDRAWATFHAFAGMVLWMAFGFLFSPKVGDERWRLFDPALLAALLAFGAALIRIRTAAVVEDLQRLRSGHRLMSHGPGLLFSAPMLLLACALMGHFVNVCVELLYRSPR